MTPTIPNDSIRVVVDGLDKLSTTSPAEWIMNVITLLIALGGLVISIVVARMTRSDSHQQSISSRKLELMKTLILDHQMSVFYEHFKKLQVILAKLKNKTCNKRDVEKEIQPVFRSLNEELLVLFRAIDEKLYKDILDQSDQCRDKLVESIADDGINLFIENKYKEHIQQPLTSAQQEIIRIIYNYTPQISLDK